MLNVLFATGNNVKFEFANLICMPLGVELEQVAVDVDEIQGENPELIVTAKAKAIFEKLQKPVIVSDDTWAISALNGFPGAYMKSMNHWFGPEEFIRLMDGKADRLVVLHQYLAYIDEHGITLFSAEIPGRVLEKPTELYGHKDPWMSVVAMDVDKGKSLAQVWNAGEQRNPKRVKASSEAWNVFAKWYKEKEA